MDKARGAIKKAAGKLPGIETEEAREGPSAREEGSATRHQEYFRELIEETRACRHLSQARAQTRWTPARKFLAVFS
jgi:hypothetical protein